MSDQEFGSNQPGPGSTPTSTGSEGGWQTVPQYPAQNPPPGYAQQPPAGYAQQQQGYAQQQPPGYGPPPGYAQPAGAGLSDNAAGAIAYLTIIPAIVFLVIEPYKSRPFVRFHAMQCLVLAGLEIVVGIVTNTILLWRFAGLIDLVIFVFWVIALVQASQGRMYRIPVVGDIAASLAKT